ncbi:hypothetical protein SLS56_010024 [Neofusicoccum ribis]|uniref:BZIP domain-containing protein n=1 Tax=Neofusicoccum ribis TaxID=45134 RepID=A0ABR3SFN6_9PEZI
MAKSTSVPIYSLPNTNGLTLPPEDDWTRAKDRREKKKIQNRVAQRTYRKPVPCTVKRIQRLTVTGQRMKARLGELQARVDYHEERSASLQRAESNDASRSASAETRSVSPTSAQPLPATTSTTLPLPNPPDQHTFDGSRAEAGSHDNLFLPSAQLFDSSLFRQTSPQASNDRPPQPLSDMPTQEPNLSSEFMQECLRFQMQLLNKITPPEDSGFSGFFDEKDDMSPSSPSNARDPLHTNHGAAQHAAPPKTAPLDERIEYVLECAQTAGFDSFDALASAYYTGTFDDGSLLAAEQRLSRNRRLSKLLADVFDAARGWSAWERRGFHEEILQSAEAMLVAECAGFARLLDERGQGGGATGTGEALLHDQAAVKRLSQNEVSWRCVPVLLAATAAGVRLDLTEPRGRRPSVASGCTPKA